MPRPPKRSRVPALATNPYKTREGREGRAHLDEPLRQKGYLNARNDDSSDSEREDHPPSDEDPSKPVDQEATRDVLALAREEMRQQINSGPKPFAGEDFGLKPTDGDVKLTEEISLEDRHAAALQALSSENQSTRNASEEQKIFEDVFDSIQAKVPDSTNSSKAAQTKLDEKEVRSLYTKLGEILASYKSGKPPKPLVMLPILEHWQVLLRYAKPENWTINAIYEATRRFSRAGRKIAGEYYSMVILPRFQAELAEHKKLRPVMFKAMLKATDSTAAFFTSVVFPLLKSGRCTATEATVMAGILSRAKLNTLHGSAGLMQIADLKYTTANSILLKALLEKRYTLAYKVIDSLFSHFLRYRNVKTCPDPYKSMSSAMNMKDDDDVDMDEVKPSGRTRSPMPKVWHESFLVFVQAYKRHIVPEQKEELVRTAQKQFHPLLSPQILKEISDSDLRDDLIMFDDL